METLSHPLHLSQRIEFVDDTGVYAFSLGYFLAHAEYVELETTPKGNALKTDNEGCELLPVMEPSK